MTNKESKATKMYINSIIEDVQTRFVSEETTFFSENRIERMYEFADGAIVKYEWQSPFESGADGFNHKFTLSTPPKPNPEKLKVGVLRVITYDESEEL
ncbi:MAG: hypothetical protein ACK5NT_09070 [Pyrinomonadaceae bacterium]